MIAYDASLFNRDKTRAEIEYYRKILDNQEPFISENGGGIFIPKGYFQFTVYSSQFTVSDEDEYHVIRFGARYSELRKAIEELGRDYFGQQCAQLCNQSYNLLYYFSLAV